MVSLHPILDLPRLQCSDISTVVIRECGLNISMVVISECGRHMKQGENYVRSTLKCNGFVIGIKQPNNCTQFYSFCSAQAYKLVLQKMLMT